MSGEGESVHEISTELLDCFSALLSTQLLRELVVGIRHVVVAVVIVAFVVVAVVAAVIVAFVVVALIFAVVVTAISVVVLVSVAIAVVVFNVFVAVVVRGHGHTQLRQLLAKRDIHLVVLPSTISTGVCCSVESASRTFCLALSYGWWRRVVFLLLWRFDKFPNVFEHVGVVGRRVCGAESVSAS